MCFSSPRRTFDRKSLKFPCKIRKSPYFCPVNGVPVKIQTMKVKELKKQGAKEFGLKLEVADAFVDFVFASINKTFLEDGDRRYDIAGLGTFTLRDMKARTGRNPQNGESVEIPATVKLVFKATPSMRSALNQKYLG